MMLAVTMSDNQLMLGALAVFAWGALVGYIQGRSRR